MKVDRPSSRKALAAVCAASKAGHLAKACLELRCAWPALSAAQTAASALRLDGRILLAAQPNPLRRGKTDRSEAEDANPQLHAA